MATLDANSVDTVICDPPYGLEFMGKEWDRLGSIGQASHAGPKPAERGQKFSDRQRVTYNASSNRRCLTCEHWEYSGTPCKCESPVWPNVKAHQAAAMQEWHRQWAEAALRVVKPGGFLLAFGGTRTFHRLACALEDAGWELRDTLCWLYGSGFPKSLDIQKALLAKVADQLRDQGVEQVEWVDADAI